MGNPDLGRIINSDEVQSVVRPTKSDTKRRALKKNPLKNLGALLKLNPYAKTARRMELLAQERQAKAKAEKLQSKRSQIKVSCFSLIFEMVKQTLNFSMMGFYTSDNMFLGYQVCVHVHFPSNQPHRW